MCLGVPGKIIEIYTVAELRMGKVDFGGVIREICLETVPEAIIGDYTIVHAGLAISLLNEQQAQLTIDALQELGLLDDSEHPIASGESE